MSKVDPKKAAQHVHDAMKGFGCDDKKLIETLADLDPDTLKAVRGEFSDLFHKDLLKEIKSETSGNLQRTFLAILKDPVEYDAWLLYDAIEGLGTNDTQLVEVLVSRHPDHLKKVIEFFQKNYGKSVDEWISGDTSGDYRDYLLSLAAANRESNTLPVNAEKLADDVAKLYKAGEGTVGTDEKAFIAIFSKRSWKHLRRVTEEYGKKYSHSLFTALEKEFSGDIYKALRWTVEFVENRQAFFAKRLHESMKGLGTDDKTLVRIIVSRRHVDLYEIADEYTKIFGKSLKESINSEISGNYRTLIQRIVATAVSD
jgi:annexin A7/11